MYRPQYLGSSEPHPGATSSARARAKVANGLGGRVGRFMLSSVDAATHVQSNRGTAEMKAGYSVVTGSTCLPSGSRSSTSLMLSLRTAMAKQ